MSIIDFKEYVANAEGEEQKIKRTFVLDEKTIDMLYDMKKLNKKKSLSDIVNEAITYTYEKKQ